MRWLRHPAVYWAVAIVLGGVFIYASLDKIAHPREFAQIVYHYQLAGPNALLSASARQPARGHAPWLERHRRPARHRPLAAGGCGDRGRPARGVPGRRVVRAPQGIDIANCGCFSVTGDGRAAGWKLMAGDMALLVAAVYVMLVRPQAVGIATDEHRAVARS